MKKIRNRLKQVLAEKSKTPYWLAKQAGLSRTTVYALCNNPDRLPDGDVLLAVCTALDIAPGDWLERSE